MSAAFVQPHARLLPKKASEESSKDLKASWTRGVTNVAVWGTISMSVQEENRDSWSWMIDIQGRIQPGLKLGRLMPILVITETLGPRNIASDSDYYAIRRLTVHCNRHPRTVQYMRSLLNL